MSPSPAPSENAPPSTRARLRRLEPEAWSSDDAGRWHELAGVYRELGWQPEAEAAWRRALRLDPTHAAALAPLVDRFLEQGLPYSAMRVLQTVATAQAPETAWRPRLEELQARHPIRRVSVYTPGYGAEDYLERCLR